MKDNDKSLLSMPGLSPLQTLPEPPCVHKYILLQTRKWKIEYQYNADWFRIDEFFCEKCLNLKQIKYYENGTKTIIPEWYQGE